MLLNPRRQRNQEISLRRLLLPLFLLSFMSCRSTPYADESRFEFSQPQMGVPFRIVLYAASKTNAEAAASAAFRRIAQLNDILSDYDTDSELNRLCRTAGQGVAVSVSPDLWTVLARSQQIAYDSDGAFDITVRPVVSLWRNARREKKFPDSRRLAEARALVGWTNLVLNQRNRTAQLLLPDMRLDLGGIAKGYAVDEAMKVLRAHGIQRVLVSGGGDLAVSGPPPGQKGWRIEIAPLDAPNAPGKKFVLLSHRALATSGDVFQHVELDGKRYSHIVDPRTGIGLTDHSLVTIIARDCTTADVLATAVSVLGPSKGIALVEPTSGAAAYIVRKPAETPEIAQSKRFGGFVER
jgi:thiamine biosynthesis lipoprotein